jgi:hypothetical protein
MRRAKVRGRHAGRMMAPMILQRAYGIVTSSIGVPEVVMAMSRTRYRLLARPGVLRGLPG